MTSAQVTLALAAQELGLEFVALRGAAPVRVSRNRGVILCGDQPMSPGDAVERLAQAPDHPGWEATCSGCQRVFLRSKPALQVHQCSTCRLPLEFQ